MKHEQIDSLGGACLCGAVRFVAGGIETAHHACHCAMCHRWSGGPLFATRVESLQFDDEAALQRYDSSEWAERGFCGNCGSNLYYYLKPKNEYHVCVGSFDDAGDFRLAVEVFVDQRRGDYGFAGTLQSFTEEEVFAAAQSDGQ